MPFPSPGDPPNPGIKPKSPALQADSLPFELPGNDLLYEYLEKDSTLSNRLPHNGFSMFTLLALSQPIYGFIDYSRRKRKNGWEYFVKII